MKKRLFAAILPVVLIGCMGMTALAETVTGADNWSVTFTPDEKMESNFTTASLSESMSGLQPGDDAYFTVSLSNTNPNTTDWYMTNEVLESLEDYSNNKSTNGGAYTYILTYTDNTGKKTTLYDSDLVGGDASSLASAATGLHQATNSLSDFFYLDTLEPGQAGRVDLYIMLDGETQGNDYQDTQAKLQMNFATMLRVGTPYYDEEEIQLEDRYEYQDEETIRTKIVKTGDETRLLPLYIVCGVSGILLLILVIMGFKTRKKQGKESVTA